MPNATFSVGENPKEPKYFGQYLTGVVCMRRVYEIFAVLGLLAVSIFVDNTYHGMKTADITLIQSVESSMTWLKITGTFFITIVLLLISWYLLCPSCRRSSIVTVICILLGGTVLFATTISGYRFIAQDIFIARVVSKWFADVVSSNMALTSHSAAYILAIGFLRLLPNRYLRWH